MSVAPTQSCRPALEVLDAAAEGLSRESLEPAAIWLAVEGWLHGEIEIEPPNGVPASAWEVAADLYDGLVQGFVRFDGERFLLTRAGVAQLDAAGMRASEEARTAIHHLPSPAELEAELAARLG